VRPFQISISELANLTARMMTEAFDSGKVSLPEETMMVMMMVMPSLFYLFFFGKNMVWPKRL
jgi:hypothetical protein